MISSSFNKPWLESNKPQKNIKKWMLQFGYQEVIISISIVTNCEALRPSSTYHWRTRPSVQWKASKEYIKWQITSIWLLKRSTVTHLKLEAFKKPYLIEFGFRTCAYAIEERIGQWCTWTVHVFISTSPSHWLSKMWSLMGLMPLAISC